MKSLIKKIFDIFQTPIDGMLAALAIPAALPLLLYRRIGSRRLPLATACLKKIGLFPIRNHYSEPLFDDRQLRQSLSEDRHLPGIDLNVSGQLNFLHGLSYSAELTALNLSEPSSEPRRFYINNGSFEAGDAEFLYQFIRATKPGKIIEIGSGNSTKIAKLALEKNREETRRAAAHICVEPYERPWLEQLGGIEVIRRRVEDCEFNWATELCAGDMLFIDSSHIIRPQGDVLKEYLDILPQLTPGVTVHIHDIFTPRDYPRAVVAEHVWFWNEQYLLEALLSNSVRYEIIAAVNFLKHHHYEALQKACPYLTKDREPGSFYMRVR